MPPRIPFSLPALSRGISSPSTLGARLFSSTPAQCAKSSKQLLAYMLRNVPPYPYPIQHTFKQSWFGLYGGRHIQFGNKVSESEKKSRRTWLPNVKTRKLWSHALKRWVEVRVVVGVLRTIDKCGGLDGYLTGEKPARIKELGPMGWKLRWQVLNTKGYEEQLAREKVRLGLMDASELPAKKDAEVKTEEVPVQVEDAVMNPPTEERVQA